MYLSLSNLEDDKTTGEVGVEVVDPRLDAQRVHPVPVHLGAHELDLCMDSHLLLPGLLDLLDVHLLRRGLQAGVHVEQVGNKGQVQPLMAFYHILQKGLNNIYKKRE